LSAFVVAAAEKTYTAPGVEDFWQPLIGSGAFAITRAAIVFGITAVVLAVVLVLATRKLTMVPSKGQMLLEETYGFVRNSIARDIIGSKDFLKFVPLLFSLFTVILVSNLLGVTPVVYFPTMSRVAFPAALTAIVFFLYHGLGVKKHGFFGWFKRMGVPPGVPVPLVPVLFFLEMINYFFTRPVTLALRLFGNMFAGHILLLLFILGGEYLVVDSGKPFYAVAGVASWVMAFGMTLFELLVEVLQAYIFTLLAALYIADALSDDH
jgi:F-type H+-transporting ATPase subunit a